MTAAAFRATFSDWKLVRSRKVIQVVFEVPLEQADHAYGVLGGMPNPASEVWCAVARLKQEGGGASGRSMSAEHDAQPRSQQDKPAGGAKRAFHELSGAQQAGILCNEPAFRRWLAETGDTAILMFDVSMAADEVRGRLGINSRAEIDSDPRIQRHWQSIVSAYRAWHLAPEVVG